MERYATIPAEGGQFAPRLYDTRLVVRSHDGDEGDLAGIESRGQVDERDDARSIGGQLLDMIGKVTEGSLTYARVLHGRKEDTGIWNDFTSAVGEDSVVGLGCPGSETEGLRLESEQGGELAPRILKLDSKPSGSDGGCGRISPILVEGSGMSGEGGLAGASGRVVVEIGHGMKPLPSKSRSRRPRWNTEGLPDLEAVATGKDVAVGVEDEFDVGGVAIEFTTDGVETVSLLHHVTAGRRWLGWRGGFRSGRIGFDGGGRTLAARSRGDRLEGIAEADTKVGHFAVEANVVLAKAEGIKVTSIGFAGKLANDFALSRKYELLDGGCLLGVGGKLEEAAIVVDGSNWIEAILQLHEKTPDLKVRLGGLEDATSHGKKLVQSLFLTALAKVGASAFIGRITLLIHKNF